MTKKHYPFNFFRYFFPILLFSIIFIISRLQNLVTLPVFGDEAIYIRWSQIIKNVETLRFLPLTDGKQPLFMWFVAMLLKFFINPLYAGRFVSVLSGLGNGITIYFILCILLNYKYQTNNPINFIFSSLKTNYLKSSTILIIYLLLPFSFFFDRLALADNLLSLFGSLSLLFSLLLSKYNRLDISFILGFVLGLSWLTKSPAIFFIISLFFTYFFLNGIKSLTKLYYPVISSIIAFSIFNTLRLGPQFHQIALRNKDYVWPISQILLHPLDPLIPHIRDVINIYARFISWPIIIFFILILLISIYKKRINKFYYILLFWSLFPLLVNTAFAKVFTARYILFTLPPLLIIFGFLLTTIKVKFQILSFLLFIPNLLFIYQLSFRPFYVDLPSTETGYIKDWTSGWGIKETANYLIIRSQKVNVIVGTEGSFGTLPDGLQIYTDSKQNLTIIGVGLQFTHLPTSLVNAKIYGDEVYLLINKSRNQLVSEELSKLKIIYQFPKPDTDSLILYQL